MPLIDAAGANDLERVEQCLAAGEDVEISDDGGRTPLIAAVGYGYDSEASLTIATRLLEAGARVDAVDKFGRSAIYFAASEAKVDIVQLFRAKGVRIMDHLSLPAFVSGWPRRMDASKNKPACFQQVFDWLIEEKPPLDAVDDEGRTALILACSENITDVALRLIALGADVNIQDGRGWSALMRVSHRRNLKVVQALLKAGADANAFDDRDKKHSLSWACLEKHAFDVAQALLADGANINHADKDGCTALMEAVTLAEMDTIRLLLESGADINQQDHQGKTALAHAAYWRDHEAVVRLLLEHGADTFIADYSGRLPLDIAQARHHAGAVEILGSSVATNRAGMQGWSELAQAIFNDDTAVFKAALRACTDIHAVELDGRNALQIAVYHHRKAMVVDLLTFANCNVKHSDTASALHIAVERGFGDLVELLLKLGADINDQNIDGETPLYRAVANADAALTVFLLKEGADPNIGNTLQKTALMAAAAMEREDIVAQLIAAGADVNRTDRFSRSALFIVADSSTGSAAVARLLIEAGADVNADADVGGEISILQKAVINGHVEMVKLLRQRGAD